ncbi:MarR family transcriptional regulator [bacterium]|nr:MarR family transcriptional regulator [bacterium]
MVNNDFVILLLKAYPMLMRKLMHDYQPPADIISLNRSQWRTLFLLHNIEKPSMSQISKFMNMEKGSITTVVDGLIRKGLVNRIQDEKDRRKILLELSKQSEIVIKKGMKAISHHILTKLNSVNDKDADNLYVALKTIFAIAEKL